MSKALKGVWLFLFSLWLLVACSSPNQFTEAPQAIEGNLGLQGWDFDNYGPVSLSGEWAFYWKELLSPSEIETYLNAEYVPVPNSWTSYEFDGQALQAEGYATYHLMLQLPNSSQTYGLFIEGEGTAYTLWVDGKLVAQNGQVGTSVQRMIPKSKPESVFFQPTGDGTELIIQISNFQHRKAGFRNPLMLGLASQINTHHQNAMVWDAFILGIYLVMGLYHVVIYSFRPVNQSSLYFALACFLGFVRKGLLDQKLIIILIPGMSWEIALHLEYLTFYYAAPLFGVFLQSLYPEDFHRWVIRTMLGLATIFSLVMFLIDTLTLSNTVSLYQGITLVEILYLAFSVVRIIAKKRESSKYIAVASLILFAGFIFEILSLQSFITTQINGTATFLGFVMVQAILLSSRLSKSFHRAEVLSNELEERNASLRASERKYRSIFEESNDMIFIAELDEQIKDANPSSMENLGYSRDELLNMKISDLVVLSQNSEQVKKIMREQGIVKDYELELRQKDGNIIHGLLTLTYRRNENGEVAELQGNVHDISARKQAEVERVRAMVFEQLSITDPLTNIYNRRVFDEIAVKEWERAKRSKSLISIAIFDIDHFKQVNDTYGHLIGDKVLSNLANLCLSNMRSMDIFARYGGEEFVIIMPDTNSEFAYKTIERLRITIKEAPLATYENKDVFITISTGLATWKAHNSLELRSLLYRADQALYTSKQTGRNKVTIWKEA